MPSCVSISLALLGVAFACPAQAQPGGKLMRIVVPFAAGGARGGLARTFSREFGAAPGGTAVIVNPPGARGAVGPAGAAKAGPAGHTLVFARPSPHTPT